MTDLTPRELNTLDRVMSWGEVPVRESDVERTERAHEERLAATPEDDGATS